MGPPMVNGPLDGKAGWVVIVVAGAFVVEDVVAAVVVVVLALCVGDDEQAAKARPANRSAGRPDLAVFMATPSTRLSMAYLFQQGAACF